MFYSIFIFFLLFIYFFNLQIIFPPQYLIFIPIMVGVFRSYIMFSNGVMINRHVLVLNLLLLAVIFCYAFTVFVNQDFDLTYLKSIFVGSIFFEIAAFSFLNKINNSNFIKMLSFVFVFQILVSLIISLNINISNFVYSFISLGQATHVDELRESRIVGLGLSFFGAGSIYCIFLIILADSIGRKKDNLILFLCYIFIALVGIMISRTTVIGVIASIFLMAYRNNIYLIKYFIYLILVTFIFLPIIFIFFKNERFLQFIDFGFDLFTDYENSQAKGSFDILIYMLENKLPDNLRTWMVGDGYFTSPGGGYYKTVDVGYLRLIYANGLIGLIVFLIINIYLVVFIDRKYVTNLGKFLIVFVFLILNIKGIFSMFSILVPFFLISNIRWKKEKPIN